MMDDQFDDTPTAEIIGFPNPEENSIMVTLRQGTPYLEVRDVMGHLTLVRLPAPKLRKLILALQFIEASSQ